MAINLPKIVVDRRIGGLEKCMIALDRMDYVDRRIGGLETILRDALIEMLVDRRIGGLEKLRPYPITFH